MVLVVMLVVVLAGALSSSTPSATPEAFTCVPTVPNHVAPPPALAHYVDPATTYFMDGIWATIPPDGRAAIGPSLVVAQEGAYAHWRATKFPWTRDEGIVGPLIVTGYRLDAAAPAAIDLAFDRQYGATGFTPVLLAFPTPGCWQLTGTVGDHRTTFVLEVSFVAADPWLATPRG